MEIISEKGLVLEQYPLRNSIPGVTGALLDIPVMPTWGMLCIYVRNKLKHSFIHTFEAHPPPFGISMMSGKSNVWL